MSYFKDQFVHIYKENIKREGADKLFEFICASDFFTAPASSRFHLARPEGLCEHSVNVFRRLDPLATGYSAETKAIAGLLHDLCKISMYKQSFRNVKVNEKWEKVPSYDIDDAFPYGHGEKSVFIISRYMSLSPEEAMAINWHMGGFDDRVKGGSFSLSGAYSKYPLAVYLHAADLMAGYIDESSKEVTHS